MIVDLHAHYPMHVVPGGKVRLWRLLFSGGERRRLWQKAAAVLIGIASRFRNYASFHSGPRVRVAYMEEGNVGVALSVLYSFFDEADIVGGTEPDRDYLKTLTDQLEAVRDHVEERHRGEVVLATDPDLLAAAERDGKLALVHCVEGGFHLGPSKADVERAVSRLAELGVAYITLAHLIWRHIATDAPALPWMTDAEYRKWLPQPDEGLSTLGLAAVETMVRERVLIDLSHMSERSIADTFALLEEHDPGNTIPVIATHAGYRFGEQEYMLNRKTIEGIAVRDGVIGLIFARHQIEDGPPPVTGERPRGWTKQRRFRASFEALCAHIDEIERITGSHRHVAIGSDFDGFIKPTLPGLRDMRDMARLERALIERYGPGDGKLICSENALRPLRTYWGGGAAPA